MKEKSQYIVKIVKDNSQNYQNFLKITLNCEKIFEIHKLLLFLLLISNQNKRAS